MKTSLRQLNSILDACSSKSMDNKIREILNKNFDKNYNEVFDIDADVLLTNADNKDRKRLKTIGLVEKDECNEDLTNVNNWKFKLVYVEEKSLNKHGVYANYEEAEIEFKVVNLMISMRSWARFHNGDWKPDWQNLRQDKWLIELYEGKLSVQDSTILNLGIFQISLKTQELAEKMLKEFKKELEEVKNWL